MWVKHNHDVKSSHIFCYSGRQSFVAYVLLLASVTLCARGAESSSCVFAHVKISFEKIFEVLVISAVCSW
jgi:hypothetical protein